MDMQTALAEKAQGNVMNVETLKTPADGKRGTGTQPRGERSVSLG